MTWTAADVDAVARATLLDLLPPLEILERLGPNPPDDYLMALGTRVLELHQDHLEDATDVVNSVLPYVAVDDAEDPPWGNDRSCPVCGEPDLPLHDSDPPALTFIKHCGKVWVRGPIQRP